VSRERSSEDSPSADDHFVEFRHHSTISDPFRLRTRLLIFPLRDSNLCTGDKQTDLILPSPDVLSQSMFDRYPRSPTKNMYVLRLDSSFPYGNGFGHFEIAIRCPYRDSSILNINENKALSCGRFGFRLTLPRARY
jgi:hypothetical protein